MTEFDAEKFEDKYVHYFEELETAYSNAYNALHGQYDSEVLRAVDRQILSESEPIYDGDGEFHVRLPDDATARIESVPGDEATIETVLTAFTDGIERELNQRFEFDSAE